MGDERTQAEGKLNEAVGSLQKVYGRATDRAREVMGRTRRQAETTYSDVDTYLHRKPFVGLGIGAALGVLLALFLRGGLGRDNSRRHSKA